MVKFKAALILALLIAFSGSSNLFAQSSSTNYRIPTDAIAPGGKNPISPNYRISDCIGQPTPPAVAASNSYIVYAGYIYTRCDCYPGDADGTGGINMLDILYLIAYLYKGGPPPKPYVLCSADPDGSCTSNMLDILHLIAYLYKGGPAPLNCGEWLDGCGTLLR